MVQVPFGAYIVSQVPWGQVRISFLAVRRKSAKLLREVLFLVPDCDNKVWLCFFCGDQSCYSVGVFNNDAGVFL